LHDISYTVQFSMSILTSDRHFRSSLSAAVTGLLSLFQSFWPVIGDSFIILPPRCFVVKSFFQSLFDLFCSQPLTFGRKLIVPPSLPYGQAPCFSISRLRQNASYRFRWRILIVTPARSNVNFLSTFFDIRLILSLHLHQEPRIALDFVLLRKLVRLSYALYAVSTRQVEILPLAPFRFHLTMDTLAFG